VACAIAFVCLSLAACGGGSSASSTPAAPNVGATAGAAVTTLEFSGPAQDSAIAGERFRYRPDLGDTGGATLAFSAEGVPAWATFDVASGDLVGTPSSGDVGTTADVRITARSGAASATFALKVQVVAAADRVASIDLQAPQTRVDGTSVGALAGYRIYYGKRASQLDRYVDVSDAALTSVQVSELTPGTWYFVATAYDADGIESPFSEIASRTIG